MKPFPITPHWTAIVVICSLIVAGSGYTILGLTWPALKAQMHGQALPHNSTWIGILLADLLGLSIAEYLIGSILAHARILFTEEGIRKPGLTGPTFIRWADVNCVKRYLHAIDIFTPQSRIHLRPMVFKERKALFQLLRTKVPAGAYRIHEDEEKIWY